jgi:hypothetical protein
MHINVSGQKLQPTIANWRPKTFIQLQVFYNKNYRRVLYFKSFINDVAECCKTLQTHLTSFSINPTTKLQCTGQKFHQRLHLCLRVPYKIAYAISSSASMS